MDIVSLLGGPNIPIKQEKCSVSTERERYGIQVNVLKLDKCMITIMN